MAARVAEIDIASKFEGFVFDPRLRNIFGQKHSTIDLREILDSGKILLVSLARGELSETTSRFMGMILLALLQNAALGRIRAGNGQRRPFFLYVDEFQSIATQNFVSLLSEGRKFGLGLILANQFTSQIRNARIMESILGNVGTLLAFRTGPHDSELIEREMFPVVDASDFMNLPNHTAYLKALTRGEPSRPFIIQTRLPATPLDEATIETVRALSRKKYSKPRSKVEEQIALSFKCAAEPALTEED